MSPLSRHRCTRLRPARRRTSLTLNLLETRAVPATYTVTSLGDTGAAGELRQALALANDETNSPGEDTITFTVSGTITLNTGELAITSSVRITGPGAASLTVSGNKLSRVFNVATAEPVTLSGLTVADGFDATVSGGGAGINLSAIGGNLTVEESVITGNEAFPPANATGGGVYVRSGGNLTMRRTTVSNNTAFRGAGLYFFNGGSLLLEGCTLSGNAQISTGDFNGGGGLYFFGPVNANGFTVRNSTISGNSAFGQGGGISLFYAEGTFTILNSTITNNTSALPAGGGGVATYGIYSVNLDLVSTIISGNTSPGAPDVYVYSYPAAPSYATGTNCLIGVADNFTLSGTGNKTGSTVSPLDASLGPLADNGGPTQTHALQASSLALNSGVNPAGLASDQRGPGFARTAGAATDIGAFEVQAKGTPPTVAKVEVNGGVGAQRSMVTSLKVSFSEAVSFPSGVNAAFRLNRTGPGVNTGSVNLNAVQSGNSVTITFQTGGTVGVDPANSLIDGAYQLTVFASKVTGAGGNLDGDGDGTGGDDFQTPATGAGRLTRLFGDNDGDGDVDVQDFGSFRAAFGTASVAYDFDADGDVDAQDFGQFRARFGTAV